MTNCKNRSLILLFALSLLGIFFSNFRSEARVIYRYYTVPRSNYVQYKKARPRGWRWPTSRLVRPQRYYVRYPVRTYPTVGIYVGSYL